MLYDFEAIIEAFTAYKGQNITETDLIDFCDYLRLAENKKRYEEVRKWKSWKKLETKL